MCWRCYGRRNKNIWVVTKICGWQDKRLYFWATVVGVALGGGGSIIAIVRLYEGRQEMKRFGTQLQSVEVTKHMVSMENYSHFTYGRRILL